MKTSHITTIDWWTDDLILTDEEMNELQEHADEHIGDMTRDGYECGHLGTDIYRGEDRIEVEGWWEKQ